MEPQANPADADTSDVYAISDAAEVPRPALPAVYLSALKKFLEAPPARKPLAKLPVTSGVLGFPWHPEMVLPWLVISAGLTVTLGVAIVAATFGPVVLMILGVPVVGISVWSFSYAATCVLTVIEDTAAGNDRIVNWPEMTARERILPAIHVAFQLSVAVGLGYFGGWLAGLALGASWHWPLAGVIAFLLFPLLLLSTLETDSPLQPFSLPVLRSIIRRPTAWLAFYALTAATGLAWAAVAVGGFYLPAVIVLHVIVVGSTLSAWILIYARALGRLALSVQAG